MSTRPAIPSAASMLALAFALAATALGQTVAEDRAPVEPVEPWLRPITQGGRDVGALSESLRQTSLELAFPLGFRNVYEVRGTDLFARQSGAVYAIFPRSEYMQYEGRTVALWPAGTQFFIGTPTRTQAMMAGIPVDPLAAPRPGEVVAGVGDARIAARVDARATRGASDQRPPAPAVSRAEDTTPAPLPRYMQDESYRRAVLAELARGAR